MDELSEEEIKRIRELLRHYDTLEEIAEDKEAMARVKNHHGKKLAFLVTVITGLYIIGNFIDRGLKFILARYVS